MSILADELRKPQYQDLFDQAAADAVEGIKV